MIICKSKDYEGMSRKAASIISAQIAEKPDSVIGLATGSSPVGTYKYLVEWYKQGDIDFSGITSINLDEYKGLSSDNDQSYRYFMNENLFNHVNINKENINVPDGLQEDAAKECTRYDNIINNSGGIDLQLLGLGYNGHIGFNEPADAFEKNTHLVKLSENTIEANARFFDNPKDVPKFAYTMGIGSIMSAKKVLLIVSGKGKAEIIKKAFFGPITPNVPASILQFHHNFILVADSEALSLI